MQQNRNLRAGSVRITSLPVAGTECVDDLVDDRANYCYVVMAINAKGRLSDSSNEAPAAIPTEKQTSSAAVKSPPPPLCRGASDAR